MLCFYSFISYPRTETNIFPKDIDLLKLVAEQTNHPLWGGFAQNLLQLPGGPTPRNGRKTDKAHPPIHPTKFTNSLSVRCKLLLEFWFICEIGAFVHNTAVLVAVKLPLSFLSYYRLYRLFFVCQIFAPDLVVATMPAVFLTHLLLPACHNVNRFVAFSLVPLL